MPIQQKLPPPVLLIRDFAGWESSFSTLCLNLFYSYEEKRLFDQPKFLGSFFVSDSWHI